MARCVRKCKTSYLVTVLVRTKPGEKKKRNEIGLKRIDSHLWTVLTVPDAKYLLTSARKSSDCMESRAKVDGKMMNTSTASLMIVSSSVSCVFVYGNHIPTVQSNLLGNV